MEQTSNFVRQEALTANPLVLSVAVYMILTFNYIIDPLAHPKAFSPQFWVLHLSKPPAQVHKKAAGGSQNTDSSASKHYLFRFYEKFGSGSGLQGTGGAVYISSSFPGNSRYICGAIEVDYKQIDCSS